MCLKNIFLLLCLFSFSASKCQRPYSDIIISSSDEKIANDLLSRLRSEADLEISELFIKTGLHFIGTPYVSGTLEISKDEKLVINLTGMDCTTFVEYCLAFAGTVLNKSNSIDDFYERLKMIRYRNGDIDGYASRLHYFSDWIFENEERGILSDVTQQLGGVLVAKSIDFMSKHPDNYTSFKDDPVALDFMIKQEKLISARKRWYIPKEVVSSISDKIKEGDIIAIATTIDGLDVMHTGIAVKKDHDIHLLHASTEEGKVVISDKKLEEYLFAIKKSNGIIIARPR